MDMDSLSKIWELFWSIWPKNFLFLIVISAFLEAVSVIVLKLGGNRGLLSVAGYVLGFFVLAFYAEDLKYSKVTQSYPYWLVVVAVLLVFGSFFILHEKISLQLLIGFILTVAGIIIIQLSLSTED
jgi:multidrug transporter EmrE-like cation transporter